MHAQAHTMYFPSSLLLLLSILTSSHQPSLATTTTQDNPTDLSALQAFKAHITSDPHNNLTNTWTTNTSICAWTGVICNHRSHRVTALRLPRLSLSGSLAPDIANLSFLTVLDLSNNSFSGPIPPSIFNISSLEALSLLGNSLSGPIPAVHLPNLVRVSLSLNRLVGPIPPSLRGCARLQLLSLSFNALSGVIPGELGDLARLEELYLNNNSLSGPIPHSIGNLTNLTVLNLRYNALRGDAIPASLAPLARLQYLSLRGNAFRAGPFPRAALNMSMLLTLDVSSLGLFGRLPADIGLHFPYMKEIYLDGNGFTGTIPSSLSNSSELSIVEISSNMFTGSVPGSLGELLRLRILNLADNRLGGGFGFLSPMANLPILEGLSISSNPFDGILPDSLVGNLSMSLQKIWARNCSIKGRIPATLLSNLSSLIYLDMSDNALTGRIPSEFKLLENLETLSLSGNQLEGPIPEELFQSMVNLGELYLDQNALSGPISSYIANLTGLQLISLGENALSSTIPPALWGLKMLYSLNLSYNLLEGSLPKEVENLKALTEMDLSSNRFSGPLPSTLGNLQMLVNLNLFNNTFTGPIPDSFSPLISLNSLDLSSNSLSGGIPKSLTELQDLRFLNLSFNRLEGKVPNNGTFANLTSRSLMGNLALCGGAAKLDLPPCANSSGTKSRKLLLKYILPAIIVCMTFLVIVLMVHMFLKKRKPAPGLNNSNDTLLSPIHQKFVSQQEITRATNNFDEANLLGTGSFGSVYKGQLDDGTTVAVKVLNLGSAEGATKRFEAECRVMRNVRHRNLVKIISSTSNEDFKALILQYMPNGSLHELLHASPDHRPGILERVSIVCDVAAALEYLHHGCSRPVVHCDVKPRNVLLDEDMVAHLGDFGISKLLVGDNKSATPTSTPGTIGYVAPEYGLSGKATIQGDIYSFGVLLLETFTGRKPTDEMITTGLSLRQWVNDAFPDAILEVVDPSLLETGENCDDEPTDMQAKLRCLSSILELGLLCSEKSPKERMNMKDVVVKLNKIKMELKM